MTAKGLGKLAEALLNNSLCISTLRYLNVSNNVLKSDEMQVRASQLHKDKGSALGELQFHLAYKASFYATLGTTAAVRQLSNNNNNKKKRQ